MSVCRHPFCPVIVFVILIAILCHSSPAYATEMRVIDYLKGDTASQMLGWACEGLGDINGDGLGDFVVTSRGLQEMYLYLGGPHPFDNPPAVTWSNAYSAWLANVGDMDCDGVNDFIAAFARGDTLKLFPNIENMDPNDDLVVFDDTTRNWAFSIGGGGDNNKDGRPEFWLSANYYNTDTIRGYSGCDLLDAVPEFQIFLSPLPDDKYSVVSQEICNTCDLNGDSIPEVIFGQLSGGYPDYPGRICIVWGGENLSETPDLVFYAPYPHGGNVDFGYDFACLGDVSGDGIDDIWVSQGGRNYIYHGGRPFDTIPDLALDWSYMYADVENIGDINNDGYNDVMTVYDSYLFSFVSYFYCYPGMDTLPDVVYDDGDFFDALQAGFICTVGLDHSWVGDIDGDGIVDALITARTTDVDRLDKGFVILQAGWDGYPNAVDDSEPNLLPDRLEVDQNYPNPFNSGTMIRFRLPKSGVVEVRIYNLLGELITILLNHKMPAGEHQVYWDGCDSNGDSLATGIYLYRVEADGMSETRKMVLMK